MECRVPRRATVAESATAIIRAAPLKTGSTRAGVHGQSRNDRHGFAPFTVIDMLETHQVFNVPPTASMSSPGRWFSAESSPTEDARGADASTGRSSPAREAQELMLGLGYRTMATPSQDCPDSARVVFARRVRDQLAALLQARTRS